MASKSGKSRGRVTAKKAASSRRGQGKKTSVDPVQAAREGVPEAGVPPTTQGAPISATGQAVAQALGQEEVPKGKDRGAPPSQAQKDAQPDYFKGAKPKGMQAEQAIFASNGSLEPNMVASPSGLVPVSTVARDEDHAQEIMEDRREQHQKYVELRSSNRNKRLSEATVGRLGHAELRAIGEQRGYQLPLGGNRTTRTAFLAAQAEDKVLGKEEV
jgi:hypothetical protein